MPFLTGSFNNIPAGTPTVNNLSEMKSASISQVIADLTENYSLTYASGCDAASLGEEASTRLALKTRLAFEAAAAGKTAFSDLITDINSAFTTTQMRMPEGAAITDASSSTGDQDCDVWKIEVDGANFDSTGKALLDQALANGCQIANGARHHQSESGFHDIGSRIQRSTQKRSEDRRTG